MLEHKNDVLTSGQDGKKTPFKPSTNFVPKKNNETWDKSREFSKKLCKRCENYGCTKTTHNSKDDSKGKLLDTFGKSRSNGGDHNNQKPRRKFDLHLLAQAMGGEFAKILHHSKKHKQEYSRHSGYSVLSSDSSSF